MTEVSHASSATEPQHRMETTSEVGRRISLTDYMQKVLQDFKDGIKREVEETNRKAIEDLLKTHNQLKCCKCATDGNWC